MARGMPLANFCVDLSPRSPIPADAIARVNPTHGLHCDARRRFTCVWLRLITIADDREPLVAPPCPLSVVGRCDPLALSAADLSPVRASIAAALAARFRWVIPVSWCSWVDSVAWLRRQQAQGQLLCHLQAINCRRENAAGVSRPFAGRVEPWGVQALQADGVPADPHR